MDNSLPIARGALRRCLLIAVAGVAMSAQAQEARRFVIASFVGDRVSVIGAQVGVGSHLDRNARWTVPDSGGAFDKFALGAAADAISRIEPRAAVAMVSLAASRYHDEPERMLQRDGVTLPGAIVDVIEKQHASYVILITKLAGDASFALREESIGIGSLKGVGYYVDDNVRLRDVNSGQQGTGFLAPFVYVRLSLVDVQTGMVIREQAIRSTEVLATYSNPAAVTAWQVLSAEQKVVRLQQLLQTKIGEATALLIGPR